MTGLAFHVVGRPAPQGSKRALGPGRMIEQSKYVKPWRAAVEAAARVEIGALGRSWRTLDGPLALSATFRLTRPQKPKSPYPDRAPDLDKIVRATLDAMQTAGVFVNDSRIVRIKAIKFYAAPGQPTGAFIVVKEA